MRPFTGYQPMPAQMTSSSYHPGGAAAGSHGSQGSPSNFTDRSFASAAQPPATGAPNRSAHPASLQSRQQPVPDQHSHQQHAINRPVSHDTSSTGQPHMQLSNIDALPTDGEGQYSPMNDFGLTNDYMPKQEPDWYDNSTSMPTSASQTRPRSSSYSGPYARRRSAEEGPHRRTAEESTQRRRENHNAVERRRRDVINEKIKDLDALLPASFVEEVGGSTSDIHHKPNVLRRSVAYIRQLHIEREQMILHQKELERRVEQLEDLLGE